MSSEMCLTCIHHKVCRHDKNLIGDVFFFINPLCSDPDEQWCKFKEWEAAGFPCEDYLSIKFPNYCTNCSNNPANGGSGICHCILGTQIIT